MMDKQKMFNIPWDIRKTEKTNYILYSRLRIVKNPVNKIIKIIRQEKQNTEL